MTDQPLEPADIKVSYDQFQISSIISWIECNGYKPHLYVHPQHPGTRLPTASMSKEMEIINAATSAVHKMQWFDDRVEFNARFSGRDHRLVIPYHAIKAIGFAHTQTMVPLPWGMLRVTGEVEGGNKPASPVEAPPATMAEALIETVMTEHDPQDRPVISEIKLDPPTASNVRTVDFRSPRKPKQ